MKAIILAGGSGTRLRPVTLEIPKPLITVKKKPIINHLIGLFGAHGITEPIVVIHKDHVEDFAWWQKRHVAELPAATRIAVEPEPMGTFGYMRELRSGLTETFVMTNGDELKDFDLTALIAAHRANPARPLATIALVSVPNPSEYGVAVMDGERITSFLEKPANPPSNFISSGLYILEPEIFDYADFSKTYLMIEKDVFPRLASAGRLAGYKMQNARWFDCGTLARWEQAIKEW